MNLQSWMIQNQGVYRKRCILRDDGDGRGGAPGGTAAGHVGPGPRTPPVPGVGCQADHAAAQGGGPRRPPLRPAEGDGGHCTPRQKCQHIGF